MKLFLFVFAVICLEQLAPGALGALLAPLAPLVASREFFLGFFGSSLAAGMWMSIGQTALARRRRETAYKKADAEYENEKGWW